MTTQNGLEPRGNAISGARMDNEKLLKRVQELEVEVQRLKMQLAPGSSQTARVVKKSLTFVLSYWTLLSCVLALAVAIFIKIKFDVDYFESYRTIAESRKISAFHQKLGEKLLTRQEWAAAEDAFTKALEADKNNTDASYGLVKSRIFKPAAGEKFVPVETQDTMLSYLREQRPDDADLDFLQASRHWGQGQTEETKKFAEAALAKNPKFGAAQMLLSHVNLTEGNIAAAVDWCRRGLENLPDDPTAMSNMGWYLLLQGKAADAIPLLERACRSGGKALTCLVLSDALRFTGEFESARRYSKAAMKTLMDDKLNDTRFADGEWYYNYLPISAGDTENWKSGIYATSLARKQALAYFALGLDSGLAGAPEQAAEAFKTMRELEPGTDLDDFYANKIASTAFHAKLPLDDPRLVKLRALLAAPAPPAAP